MVPAWLGLIYRLSYSAISESTAAKASSTSPPDGQGAFVTEENGWIYSLSSMPPEKGAIANTAFYFITVIMTLIFTELGKSSFATTRPEYSIKYHDRDTPTRTKTKTKTKTKTQTTATNSAAENTSTKNKNKNKNKNTNNSNNSAAENTSTGELTRRYGKLVSSLKSKHSFPSGDSAQAMNLSMFLWRYAAISDFFLTSVFVSGVPMSVILLFGVFVPGVAFARVFYKCHWIEDCIGGILMSSIIHWLLIPNASEKFLDLANHLFENN
eukprot:CAMPEP_0171386824 /NCGR_PEP_ID=MMETSP0879-20121228/39687_1 /TAXON_ID=67004 /ORGANISM="Thalassiosira weissflogii, Strain CCMP1336" /LENGTH=267 /DNA_ID=CAMNT_0011899143 /DNA_START=239 /DNA_END=1043 /DNA_ORIENTATION=+